MTNNDKTTKDKICDAANQLFARKGFVGTSIREIASAAGVNLGAVNYHFTTKEKLYWQVFDLNYEWMQANIESIGLRSSSTIELSRGVFQFFLSNGPALMNTFKIFLNETIEVPASGTKLDTHERFGPPGQQVFLEKIMLDVGRSVSEKNCRWAMKMIFALMVHFGLVMNTSVIKTKSATDSELSSSEIEESLIKSVSAHLAFIRNYNGDTQLEL